MQILDGYYQVANTAALTQYTFNYTNAHKAELKKKFPDAQMFLSKMTITDAQLNELLEYYKKISKTNKIELSNASKAELKLWIKALIGRNLYGNDAFYPVINTSDPVVKKACSVLKTK